MDILIGALIVLAIQVLGLAAVLWGTPQDFREVRDGWIVATLWWALAPWTVFLDARKRRRRIRASQAAARKAATWHEPRPEVIP